MKDEKIRLSQVLKNIGTKTIILMVAVMLGTLAFIIVDGSLLYSYAKESISTRGELSATQSAKDVDSYLSINTNAISLAGYNVERMLKKGMSHEEVFDYLCDETQHVLETIDKDNNGVYGWVDGEYMDTVWVPDADYVPKERPWYVDAIKNGETITYVKPYVDAQSGKVMMTISYLFEDMDSVLALDITLDTLQDVTEATAASTAGSFGMILDDDGDVVAHSDIEERGRLYSEETGTLGSLIAAKLRHEADETSYQFEIDFNQNSYIVYVVKLMTGWNSISVINANVVFRPLRLILIGTVLVSLLTIFIIAFIFYKMSVKNLITQKLNMQIGSIADIYMSMHDIDIISDTFRTISCREDVAKTIDPETTHAQDMLRSSMDKFADEMSKADILRFVDLSTLNERLKTEHSVTEEFLNSNNIWCRARFIAAERTRGDNLRRALWVIESIDAEKRRRDKLQYLSETDLMTGISNRGSGERRVSKLIDQGYGGMFIMLDADKFKSINDTYGHDVGDKVIIAIANSIKKTFRADDVVMRLGGDEFAAYAVDVFDKKVGDLIINRLFEHINKISIPELGDRKIYVSVGAAFYKGTDTYAFSELYKRADESTYESKKFTGNYVTYYED